MKTFGGAVAIEDAFDGLVEIHAEERGGIKPARQQVLGDSLDPRTSALMTAWFTTLSCTGRASEGNRNSYRLLFMPRDFAGVLAADELDALHGCRQPLVIAQIAAQAHEVLGKTQRHGARFLTRIAPQLLRECFDAFK